jgi:hypothetical protein
MKHKAKVLGLPAIMMMLTLAFPICLANSSAVAARDPQIEVGTPAN